MKRITGFILPLLISALSLNAAPVITEASVNKVVKSLTLEQKARLLVGWHGNNTPMSHITEGAAGWTYAIEEKGIPSINLADGPVGVRINPVVSRAVTSYDENGLPVVTQGAAVAGAPTAYCTAFPSTTALAATWNTTLSRLQGEAMGREARCYGVDVILSPGINIMRNPLCGRNFEYYSEDPLLTGKMAASIINGIQSQGIGTSLKHFVANNQQTGKKYNDARMTQRALREIYLKGFEICVKESHPWTVMGSYNKIAGQFTQTNQELLLTLLRDEWGFDGMCLTDWTVRRPVADLLNARMALSMPGEEDIVQQIMQCVKDGSVSEATLNACVADVLRVVARSITARGWKRSEPDLRGHGFLSRDIAAEGMVLLKNEDNVLPVKGRPTVALYGASAYKSIAGGTGSSNVNKQYVVNVNEALIGAGLSLDDRIADVYERYVDFQSRLMDAHPDCPSWQKISYHRTVLTEMDMRKYHSMVEDEVARTDMAVIVLGRGSGETSDRQEKDDFNISDAERFLIEHVCDVYHKAGKKVVVVLNVCGMIETASWKSKPDAILLAWLPGQECGDAIADVLTGRQEPSGRLPMTLPLRYSDLPASKNYPYLGQTEGKNFDYTNYEEDIWVGYRYFTSTANEVSYPFGYGLSYTSFNYSNLSVVRSGNTWKATVTITNVGNRAGKEVVQGYVKAPSQSMVKPRVELKAFAKTDMLAPGQSQQVTLSFTDYDLASFDQDNSQWLTEAGVYSLILGISCDTEVARSSFVVKKKSIRKVANILAPVSPVNTIKIK